MSVSGFHRSPLACAYSSRRAGFSGAKCRGKRRSTKRFSWTWNPRSSSSLASDMPCPSLSPRLPAEVGGLEFVVVEQLRPRALGHHAARLEHGEVGEHAAALRHERDARAEHGLGRWPVTSRPSRATCPAAGVKSPAMARADGHDDEVQHVAVGDGADDEALHHDTTAVTAATVTST